MEGSVGQSSGSRAILQLQCWRPRDPGMPLLGMLENGISAQGLEGAPFPEPARRLRFCCHLPNTFTLKEMF